MSIRAQPHRRRSQTISTADISRARADSRQTATKRACPSTLFNKQYTDPSSPQKWDVDAWRRGKRRRRDDSPESDDMTMPVDRAPFGSSATATPLFASTSAEFKLFSHIPHTESGTMSHNLPSETTPPSQSDLIKLHSSAFQELHRSVAENGENLVQRMRNYEDSRSRIGLYSKAKIAQTNGRKRANTGILQSLEPMASPEAGAGDASKYGAPERHDFLPETSEIEVLQPNIDAEPHLIDSEVDDDGLVLFAGRCVDENESERGSSPGATCDSNHSLNLSTSDAIDMADSEMSTRPTLPISTDFTRPRASTETGSPFTFTPALSHTYTSTNSSLVSLALLSPTSQVLSSSPPSSPTFSFRSPVPITMPSLSRSASRSEKAVAALTLALANGAGGVNDFDFWTSGVLQGKSAGSGTNGLEAEMEEWRIGEMWH